MSAERPEPAAAARSIPAALQAILIGSWNELRRHHRGWAALWAGTLVASVLMYPWDRTLLDMIQGVGSHRVAEVTSTIGRFENSSLLFAVVLATIGLLAGSGRWKRAAVGCLIAGIIAGLAVTVLRPSLGRARPHAEAEPGFHFLELDSALHSMPSGHVSTNTASALAIARLLPSLAAPALVYAAAMGWSRMELDRHYPTDVLWGLMLGGTIGWTVAGALRDRRPADRSRSNGPS